MKFLEALAQQFAGKPVDWDDLEHALIRADLGVPLTTRIVKKLQEQEAWSLLGISDVINVARGEISKILPKDTKAIEGVEGQPTVVLIVGVNGTGKTTSTAKLANYLMRAPYYRASAADAVPSHRDGLQNRVLLAAADTFRAAAIEQLGIWAKRLGLEMISGQYGADPAALCYDAYESAAKNQIDFLLCDTAGRLHTKANLMAELHKVKRSLAKQDPSAPHEILLVVDASTGGNALSQAREFHQALGLTGLIVTKLDGSGKGGIVVAIQDELKIPTRFIGTGEKIDDFAPFDTKRFLTQIV
ncbi:MAG TPA: signal recognition particle-docking protein FtsY [Chthoniobacterales bacterium]|nr:signal recognition particle-docking protein FtsY [Chthoniobacterales bacterium]